MTRWKLGDASSSSQSCRFKSPGFTGSAIVVVQRRLIEQNGESYPFLLVRWVDTFDVVRELAGPLFLCLAVGRRGVIR